MRKDSVSSAVIRLLRDSHHAGRRAWPNFDTVTTGAQYRLLHRLCERWVPAGARVLDWGAGTGHASIYLTRAGYIVTGYSLDPCGFSDLVNATPYRFVLGSDPVMLPFADREFDAALSVGVLEHVRETGGDELWSLSELRRVLRPGGVMICVHLPNVWSWIEALARRRPGAHTHAYRYSAADVRRMFTDAGFRIERQGRYGALPRNRVAAVFPRSMCDSEVFSRLYDAADAVGAAMAPWFVQNHYVVARRLGGTH